MNKARTNTPILKKMRSLCVVLLLVASAVSSCSKTAEETTTYSISTDFKIFVGSTESVDIIPVKIFPTIGSEVVLFCLQKESLSDKFTEDSKLFVIELDCEGTINKQNDKTRLIQMPVSGFLGDIAQVSAGEYYVIWNTTDQKTPPQVYSLSLNASAYTLTLIALPTITKFSEQITLSVVWSGGKLKLLNVGTFVDTESHAKIFAAEVNPVTKTVEITGEKEYTQKDFGSFGDNNLAFIKEYSKYISLNTNKPLIGDKVLVVAPYRQGIGLSFSGDPENVFFDSRMFVSAIEATSQQEAAILLNDPVMPSDPLRLIPAIKLDPINSNYADYESTAIEVASVSNESAVVLRSASIDNENYIIVGGTSRASSNVIVNIYRESDFALTGKQTAPYRAENLGSSYKIYRLLDIVVVGQEILIVGQTEVFDEFKRPFAIKMPVRKAL